MPDLRDLRDLEEEHPLTEADRLRLDKIRRRAIFWGGIWGFLMGTSAASLGIMAFKAPFEAAVTLRDLAWCAFIGCLSAMLKVYTEASKWRGLDRR